VLAVAGELNACGIMCHMIDPETTRLVAHVLLDAASVQSADQADDDQRDDMYGLAIDRLAEVEAVRVTQDDETGRVSVDIRRLTTASLVLINGLLDGWAAAAGVDRDQLIAELRGIVDEQVTE
jgi:hypothetical protein